MTLNGRQAKQFAEALLSGFPRRGDLQTLLFTGLGVTLDTVAGDGGSEKQVNEILVWAQANGRLDELVAAAAEARPQNADVSTLARDFARWKASAAPAPVRPATSVATADLRRVLTEAFNVEELHALCFDAEQILLGRGVTLRVDLETVGGASKPAQVLNLIQYLQRRGHIDALVDAVRAARPGVL